MTKSYNGPTFIPLSAPGRGYPPAHVNNISRLDALLVAETVRLIEAEAPLDDAEANRQAASASGDREQRLLARATLLGQRLGLQQTLQAWRARAVIAWAALALLVFIAGSGLVQGLLGNGRTINVMLAFVAALGVHFLTLAFWLLSLVLGAAGSSALALSSLGSLSLRLAAWSAGSGGGHRPQLVPAAISVLERGKLLPWLFGLASHMIWSAVFMLTLAGLWFMFSFREYQLTWETTIQSRQFFIGFIEASGVLPRMLGFPVPDAAALTTGGPDAQRTLAWWLMGCTCTYGLLPRFLLALLSAAVVARRRRRLRLDTSDPYYRKLLARMEDLGRSSVVDPERHAADEAATAAPIPGNWQGLALVGFELPPEYDWPPPGVGGDGALSINVSGAGDQLRSALQRLDVLRPARILFVCDQAASPDRGTARFLREAAACSRRAALLLLPVRGAGDGYLQRWHAWLADSELQALKTFDDGSAASAWLEERDE